MKIIKMPPILRWTCYFFLVMALRVRSINVINQVSFEPLLMGLALHIDTVENKKRLRYNYRLSGFLSSCRK